MASFGFLMPATSGTNVSNGRIFSDGLKIELDRSSPAFAALEDAWSTQQVAETPQLKESIQAKTFELVSGMSSAAGIAQQILRDNYREENLLAQERALRDANSEALTQAAGEVLKSLAAHFIVAPQADAAEVEPAQVVVSNDSGPALRGAVDGVNSREVEPPTIVKTISLTDLQMSRDELFGGLLLPLANAKKPALLHMPTLASHSAPGASIPENEGSTSIAKQIVEPSDPAKQPVGVKIESDESPAVHAAAVRSQSSLAGGKQYAAAKTTAALSSASLAGTPLHQVVVSGPIEFGDGLALSNSMDRVVIYRDVDGEAQESGQVWVREGRYEIFVEETSGVLTGELHTPYGDVVGRGVVDLSTLPLTNATQRSVSAVSIKITPVIQGLSGRVVSARNDGKAPGLKSATISLQDVELEARSFKGGGFSEPNLVEGSSVIVEATHANYWDTLTFARTGINNEIQILPDQDGQMIRQLLTLTRATGREQSSGAVVWGRALKNGKPIAGANVQMIQLNVSGSRSASAGTDAEIRPIYFDSNMQPSTSLTETTANGLYAFFPVAAGTHAVHVAFSEDSGTEPLLFPTRAKTVSQVDIEISSLKTAKVKVFDAFHTDMPVASELTNPAMLSQATQVAASGIGQLTFSDGQGPLIVDADAGRGFEKTRVSMGRDRQNLFVPMISSAWLADIRGKARINTDQGSGTVVGFVQGSTVYKVAIVNSSLAGNARVIYFNNRGDLTPDDYGQPGGGFVVFGVQEGFRTITVQGAGSPKVHSAVTLVDHNVTNVLSHWIR